MGSCVSTQTKQKSSAMKVQVLFGSNDHVVKPPLVNGDLLAKSLLSFQDYGSKEDTYFDSQAWLESDCDDDFMSVNGEFTPSRGNTPVHHNFSSGNNKPHAAVFPYDEPSPTVSEKKIRLSDLFKESLRVSYDFEDEQDGELVQNGGEVVTNNGHGSKTKKERFGSCFPTMIFSRSPSTNGRKMVSPCLG
ncbi:hypothetical protein Hdeb2414_s0012g00383311 [Helianthus debilis subsp. tardiflorus]